MAFLLGLCINRIYYGMIPKVCIKWGRFNMCTDAFALNSETGELMLCPCQ